MGSIKGDPAPRGAPMPHRLAVRARARLSPGMASQRRMPYQQHVSMWISPAKPYAMRLECNENQQTCHNAKAMDDRPVAQIAQRTINQVIEHLAI